LAQPQIFLRKARKICKLVLDRSRNESDLRTQITTETLPRELPELTEDALSDKQDLLSAFFDGLTSTVVDRGLLSLRAGLLPRFVQAGAVGNWLTLPTLDRLFCEDSRSDQDNDPSLAVVQISTAQGIVAGHTAVLAPHGADVQITVDYDLGSLAGDTMPSNVHLDVSRGSGQPLVSECIDRVSGHITTSINTSDIATFKTAVRLSLKLVMDGDVVAKSSLRLELYGEQRALIVALGDTLNTAVNGEEQEVSVSGPTHVYVASHLNYDNVAMSVNDTSIQLQSYRGVLRTEDAIRPGEYTGGFAIAELTDTTGALTSITLIEDVPSSGCFTIDEELERAVIRRNRPSVIDLSSRFSGANKDFYHRLGSMSTPARRRTDLASLFDDHENGHLPVVADLFHPALPLKDCRTESSCFRVACTSDAVRDWGFANPEQSVLDAVDEYATKRNEVLEFLCGIVEQVPASFNHPRYAFTPAYVASEESHIRELLSDYLRCYKSLSEAGSDTQRWESRFLAANIDTVVDPGLNEVPSGARLLGPWHPIVLAHRFYYQRALALFADGYVLNKHGQQLRVHELVALLRQSCPAHWLPSCSLGDAEPAMLVMQPDTGWVVSVGQAFLSEIAQNRDGEDKGKDLSASLAACTGLSLLATDVDFGEISGTVLRRFMRAFPAKRRLSVEFQHGYETGEVAEILSEFLRHKDGSMSNEAKLLPGGLHAAMAMTLPPDELSDVIGDMDSLFFYKVDEGKTAGDSAGVQDLTFLSRHTTPSIAPESGHNLAPVIRGKGNATLLSTSHKAITHGGTGWSGVQGITEEASSGSESLDGLLRETVSSLQRSITSSCCLKTPTRLPDNITSPWVYVPAHGLDPALMRAFLEDSSRPNTSARALWDYRINLQGTETTSYYVVSSIGDNVRHSLDRFLPEGAGAAEGILSEMGKVGIALEGESQRSVNKAKGCVGLIGAVRLIVGHEQADGALLSSPNAIGLTVPIDSFRSLLGPDIEHPDTLTPKMGDLLAIQCKWGDPNGLIEICAVGVEAKYFSIDPAPDWVSRSLRQGRHSLDRFRVLVTESRRDSAQPIRLALTRLLEFGLRLAVSYGDDHVSDHTRAVLSAALDGRLRWVQPTVPALTVLTQPEGPPSATFRMVGSEGAFVQLPASDWTGSKESEAVKNVRQSIRSIFLMDNIATQPTSGPAPEPAPQPTSGPAPETAPQPTSGPAPEPAPQPTSEPASGAITTRHLDDTVLEDRYYNILQALSETGITAGEVSGAEEKYRETPASVQYRIRPSYADVHRVMNKGEVIKFVLGLTHSKTISFLNDRGSIVIDAPKIDEERYYIDAADLWQSWRPNHDLNVLRVPMGINHHGETVSLDFKSCAHVLIAGQTNSGKSKAIETLILGLCRFYDESMLKMVLVDGKRGVELGKFGSLAHCRFPVGISPADAIERLETAVREMDSRYDIFRQAGVSDITAYRAQNKTGESMPWWVVVLDEYADLISDSSNRERIEDQLCRLGAQARAAGIHLVVSTQKPTVTVVNTVLKENLPARIAFRVTSGAGSRVILDEVGAEVLNGKGDGILRDTERSQRFQCAMVSDADIASMTAAR